MGGRPVDALIPLASRRTRRGTGSAAFGVCCALVGTGAALIALERGAAWLVAVAVAAALAGVVLACLGSLRHQ